MSVSLGLSIALLSGCSRQPVDVQAAKGEIQSLLSRNLIERAEKTDQQLLKENPKDLDGLIYRGEILARENRSSEAVQNFLNLVVQEPNNAKIREDLASALMAAGNAQEAETQWKYAFQIDPGMLHAARALGESELKRGDADAASQIADTLILKHADAPEGYGLCASILESKGDSAGAEAALAKEASVSPQNAIGYLDLAALRVRQKRYADAQQLYHQALERDPTSISAVADLVDLGIQETQFAEAESLLQSQIAKDPDNSAWHMLLAGLYGASQERGKAETEYVKAISLNPHDPTGYISLGNTQLLRGESDAALATYQRGIQQNPDDPALYLSLGQYQQAARNWPKAEGAFRKALQLQPSSAAAMNDLAFLLLESNGNVDEALQLAHQAVNAMPRSPAVVDTLAWAFLRKGDTANAIKLLEEVVRVSPNDPEFQYHLGVAYQSRGDVTQAAIHLQRALAINPNFDHGGDARQALQQISAR